jgi:hypothetical protein
LDGVIGVPVAHGLSYLIKRRQILEVAPSGTVRLGSRVAIFVHYDRKGEVRPHILYALSKLQEANLDVVFVTNSGKLQPQAQAAVGNLCKMTIVRRNVGYDFGAMREAIVLAGLPRPDTEMLLLMNDSVYAPLRPLSEILSKLDFARADAFGATESWQMKFHLQSYFLCFGREALFSEAWRDFWANLRMMPMKLAVIKSYEVGLTQALIREGFRCEALWPYDRLVGNVPPVSSLSEDNDEALDPIVKARRKATAILREHVSRRSAFNPTAELWRQLLENDFPFIKRELILRNPAEVPDLCDWPEVAGIKSNVLYELIMRDLQREIKNRAP